MKIKMLGLDSTTKFEAFLYLLTSTQLVLC